MNIELIENNMELSQIRAILNTVIQKVNQGQQTQISYTDLTDRPCINGVALTAQTTGSELNLTLPQLANRTDIENLVKQIGEQKAAEVASTALASKLDSDFSRLPNLRYNFNEEMLLTISDGRGIFKATVNDLLLYLKYLILKDSSFEKLASGKVGLETGEKEEEAGENPVTDPGGGETIDDPKPIKP